MDGKLDKTKKDNIQKNVISKISPKARNMINSD